MVRDPEQPRRHLLLGRARLGRRRLPADHAGQRQPVGLRRRRRRAHAAPHAATTTSGTSSSCWSTSRPARSTSPSRARPTRPTWTRTWPAARRPPSACSCTPGSNEVHYKDLALEDNPTDDEAADRQAVAAVPGCRPRGDSRGLAVHSCGPPSAAIRTFLGRFHGPRDWWYDRCSVASSCSEDKSPPFRLATCSDWRHRRAGAVLPVRAVGSRTAPAPAATPASSMASTRPAARRRRPSPPRRSGEACACDVQCQSGTCVGGICCTGSACSALRPLGITCQDDSAVRLGLLRRRRLLQRRLHRRLRRLQPARPDGPVRRRSRPAARTATASAAAIRPRPAVRPATATARAAAPATRPAPSAGRPPA